MSWISAADLSDEGSYAELQNRIDLANFIDYQVYEIFIANRDWPANNMRCWQYRNGLWRWFFYDGDAAVRDLDFNAFANAVYEGDEEYPSNRTSTLLFRKLLENNDFQKRFVNRFNSLSRGILNSYQPLPFYDEIRGMLADEVGNQIVRFNCPKSRDGWKYYTRQVEKFLEQRPQQAVQQLLSFIPVQEDAVTDVLVYPSPAVCPVNVTVTACEAGISLLGVYDMAGRQVYSDLVYCVEGKNAFSLEFPLPAGIYLLRVCGRTAKFVVQ